MDALNILQMAHEGESNTTVREPQQVEVTKDSAARKLAIMPQPKRAKLAERKIRGGGHLYLRGDMYWFEIHYKGERTRESLNTTDRETAVDRMADRVKEITQGIPTKKFEPISCQQMYDNWMSEVERNCKPRTIEDYKSRWNTHLKRFFGGFQATQVTMQRISDYLNRRMKEGAGEITQNRENRVLQMIFGHNKSLIPPAHFPEFPKMHSEKSHVRKGRLSVEDYATLQKRLDEPGLFWLKTFLTMTFKYGFRKSELLNATCSYFDPAASTFTLPAFTTKNKRERLVDLVPNGEIYMMLVALTEGRPNDAPLFHRNGKPVRDFRGEWSKQTEGMRGGSGKGGVITIHDLRRSALTNMSEKGVTAAQAGTHLTPDVFNRYITRNQKERRATAALIEG